MNQIQVKLYGNGVFVWLVGPWQLIFCWNLECWPRVSFHSNDESAEAGTFKYCKVNFTRLMQSKLAKKNLSQSSKENSCFASICREVFGAKFVSSTWCKYTLPQRASLLLACSLMFWVRFSTVSFAFLLNFCCAFLFPRFCVFVGSWNVVLLFCSGSTVFGLYS